MGHVNVKQIHKLVCQYHFLFRYFCCLVNLNVLVVLLIFNRNKFYIPKPCFCVWRACSPPKASRSIVKVWQYNQCFWFTAMHQCNWTSEKRPPGNCVKRFFHPLQRHAPDEFRLLCPRLSIPEKDTRPISKQTSTISEPHGQTTWCLMSRLSQ